MNWAVVQVSRWIEAALDLRVWTSNGRERRYFVGATFDHPAPANDE